MLSMRACMCIHVWMCMCTVHRLCRYAVHKVMPRRRRICCQRPAIPNCCAVDPREMERFLWGRVLHNGENTGDTVERRESNSKSGPEWSCT